MKELFFESTPLKSIIESLIFSSQLPLSAVQLIEALISVDPELILSESEILEMISELNKEYHEQKRSFSIIESGSAFCFKTKEFFHPWLQHIQHENINRKISQSGLEALAIIAYKQPVTKPVVDSIRGVDSGYVVRQLLEKGLIEVAGRSDSPGRPLLYKTSAVFLHHFGLKHIEDLPKPREIDEILKDDEMAEHRQMMMELKAELHHKTNNHPGNS